jgi:hypothetical protein
MSVYLDLHLYSILFLLTVSSVSRLTYFGIFWQTTMTYLQCYWLSGCYFLCLLGYMQKNEVVMSIFEDFHLHIVPNATIGSAWHLWCYNELYRVLLYKSLIQKTSVQRNWAFCMSNKYKNALGSNANYLSIPCETAHSFSWCSDTSVRYSNLLL